MTTQRLIGEVKEVKNREAMARVYAEGLSESIEHIDWRAVNQAILTRWSVSGLYYIKWLAWKAVPVVPA